LRERERERERERFGSEDFMRPPAAPCGILSDKSRLHTAAVKTSRLNYTPATAICFEVGVSRTSKEKKKRNRKKRETRSFAALQIIP